MSYNTRRGNIAFNKNISSSTVGNRRPIVTNNYVQQPPSQNSGSQPLQNQGYTTQQTPQRQQPLQRQQTPQQTAQQQLAKQQQMLVLKKQQLAQQQKQQQQKQQIAQQQKQQLAQQQKQQVSQKQQQEQSAQKQKDFDLKRQKELELQKLKELEQQKQKELEQQKQKELEQLKQRELEQQKQRQLEQQKQEELEREKQRNLEQLKQRELALQKQKQLEMQKEREMEQKKLEQMEQQKLAEKKQIFEQSPEQQLVQEQPLSVAGLPVHEENIGNGSEIKPERKRWTQRRKLSKYEIQRRRNFKLSKLLQPKNAMVILNEVVKNITYNIENCQSNEGYIFKATVAIDGIEHEGLGASKGIAKNNAAEKALKYLVKHKKLMQLQPPAPINADSKPEDGVEPMDTSEKDETDIPLAWQQFASFAVYKLLSAWGEDPQMIKEDPRLVKKPAKKLPANANFMNPLMLLNQMMPQTHFEELPRTSNGHFFTFSYKCTINGQTFVGTGTSKKAAKRQTAFAICKTILGIEYPPEIYAPPPPTPA